MDNNIIMETIMQFLKENYDLIGLFIGVVGVVIAVFSLIDEVRKKRAKEKLELEKKEKKEMELEAAKAKAKEKEIEAAKAKEKGLEEAQAKKDLLADACRPILS